MPETIWGTSSTLWGDPSIIWGDLSMGQVKLLKINAAGLPQEFDTATDDITLNSFTIQGGGPVLSGTGLDLNGQGASDAGFFTVTDPAVGYLNQTAGNLIFNNVMGKERGNTMTSAADIQFGAISDAVGEVDSLVLPKLAGAPTAVPTAGEGSFLYDSSNDKLWLYTTAGWDDLSTVDAANAVVNSFTAGENLTANDVVYISAANTVSKADASAIAKTFVVGVATSTVLSAASVSVKSQGIQTGFTGLTAGSRYFLDSTAGAISSSAPTGTGHSIVQVGYAKSTTALMLDVQQIGRRAT